MNSLRIERPIVPRLSVDEAADHLSRVWGIHAIPEPLPSYVDQNFRVTDDTGDRWVLKIANGAESKGELDFQNAVMERLAEVEPGLASTVRAALDARAIASIEHAGTTHLTRVVSYVDGTLWQDAGPDSPATWRSLGSVLGRVDTALSDLEHPSMHRSLRWDLSRAEWIVEREPPFDDPARARLVSAASLQFLADVRRVIDELPRGVIYNDANPANVCVRETAAGPEVVSIFDFGDVVFAPRVFEVAIASAYAVLDQLQPLDVVREIVGGYHAVSPLTDAELDVVFPSLVMRLAVSVTVSERDARRDPDNEYIRTSQRAAWDALARLSAIEPKEAAAVLRSVCGAPIPSRSSRSLDEVMAVRRTHFSRSLSLSYVDPLAIDVGRMQYLYDTAGRAYLDGVNNVCHVGHCHPRVVEAATRQIATLNTNTRYLNDNVLRYAERLAATFPDPLEVLFFVNSGTEANELALRLARTATGRHRMSAVDHGYHGNSSAMIDLSSYKHDGPGGRGKPPWLHRVPCPDPYRGPHTGPDAGSRYAAYVSDALDAARADGEEIAGFFVEPIMGCGGQIVPPAGYLADAFARVRAAGGVCIADEVQIGFGRVGSHMWSSIDQGAVPDILTMGKPIGNGHPMAAVVTTRAIADAFDTGMEFFSTFGGNPVSAAIGEAVLDAIEVDDLLANARTVGRHLLDGFEALATRHDVIGDIRGRGLYIGVELVEDRSSRRPAAAILSRTIEAARAEGVLLSSDGPHRNVLKIKPPMCLSTIDAELLLAVFDRSLSAAVHHR